MGGAFGVIGHEGGALMDDIKCLFILFLYLCPFKRDFGEPPASFPMCTMCLVVQSCPTFWDPMDCSLPDSSVHGDSSGKNIGVGCHALLHGSSQHRGRAQVFNPGLLYCRKILYHWTTKKTLAKRAVYAPENRLSLDIKGAGAMISDFPAFRRTMRDEFLLFISRPVYGSLL